MIQPLRRQVAPHSKNLSIIALLASVVILPGFALAETDGPVKLLNPKAISTPELNEMTRAQIHRSPNPLPYKKFTLEEVEVGFYEPVARLLANASNGAPLPQPAIDDCRELIGAMETLRPRIEAACPALRFEPGKAINSGVKACRHTRRAESFAEEMKSADYGMGSQGSIKGLLGTFSKIYLDHPWPESLWGAKEMGTWREIVVKIRADDLRSEIDGSLDRIGRLVASVEKCAPDLAPQVASLKSELVSSRSWVDRVESEGFKKAEVDSRAVTSRGRFRTELPYPALSDDDRRFLGFWLGALNWRLRGGGPIKAGGTQAARFYFLLLPFTSIGNMAGGSRGQQAGGALYPPIFTGWGKFYDMGRSGGDPYEDLVRMTDRGLYQISQAEATLSPYGFDIEILRGAGMQMGGCYWYASRALEKVLWKEQLPAPYVGFIDGFTAWGELCTGGALGLALVETLLSGSRYPH